MIYFRPRVSFSANFCPMFIAFLHPEIQSAIDQCERFLLIPGFVSPADSLLTIRDRHWRKLAATFEKAKSANSLLFVR